MISNFTNLDILNSAMDFINFFLNLAVPPACLIIPAFAWPTLCFTRACERLYNTLYTMENMEDKVVIITGASSGIGEQIAHEYAKRGASLLLVDRREDRFRLISEKANCRKFVNEAIAYYGLVDHLVNTVSLGHTFYFDEFLDTSVFPRLMDVNFWGNVYPTFVALPYLRKTNGQVIVNASVENWLPLPRMSLYSAAKAALVNFYETLRFELNDEIGLTIATHGWTGSEMSGGKFMLEEGAEMQWKEEIEVQATSARPVEEFAKLFLAGACQGDAYVKYPSWCKKYFPYGYREADNQRQQQQQDTPEVPSPRKLVLSSPGSSQVSPLQQYKIE